jgi:hypothetical protein
VCCASCTGNVCDCPQGCAFSAKMCSCQTAM